MLQTPPTGSGLEKGDEHSQHGNLPYLDQIPKLCFELLVMKSPYLRVLRCRFFAILVVFIF